MPRRTIATLAAAATALIAAGAGGTSPAVGRPTYDAPAPTARTVKLVAAGDLCGDCQPTARLARRLEPDVVVTLGDLAYNNGLLAEYHGKYGGGTTPQSRWGAPALKRITLPGYGNHDCFDVPRDTGAVKQGCRDAVRYFGPDTDFGRDIRGTPGSYATVVGNWLIVHLNSAGSQGGGQATPTEIRRQRLALRGLLRGDRHACEIVVWHHPRWSSGHHGNSTFVAPWFRTAYVRGVDVVLNGHDHDYERFARQNGDGQRASDGVMQLVVGTGGAGTRPFEQTAANSLVRIADEGVLTMRLRGDRRYTFAFHDIETGRIEDSGTRRCHH